MWRLEDLCGRADGDIVSVADEQSLRAELTRLARFDPRVVYVKLSDNEYLHVGIGGDWAFVEHVIDTPWKCECSVSNEADLKPDFVSFVAGGQDTEIPSHILLPTAEAIEVLVEFFRIGAVPSGWRWMLT